MHGTAQDIAVVTQPLTSKRPSKDGIESTVELKQLLAVAEAQVEPWNQQRTKGSEPLRKQMDGPLQQLYKQAKLDGNQDGGIDVMLVFALGPKANHILACILSRGMFGMQEGATIAAKESAADRAAVHLHALPCARMSSLNVPLLVTGEGGISIGRGKTKGRCLPGKAEYIYVRAHMHLFRAVLCTFVVCTRRRR